MIKRPFSYLLLLLLFSNLFAFEYNVISETATGMKVEILNDSHPVLTRDPMVDSLLVLSIPGADYQKLQNYLVPVWSFRIALPDTQMPQFTIENLQKAAVDIADIKPPEIFKNEQVAAINHLGLAGDIPTATLNINPVTVKDKSFTYITRIVVNITYTKKSDNINPASEQNTAYLNSHSATQFKTHKRLSKKTAIPSFPSGKWLRITITDRDNLLGYNNHSDSQNLYKIDFDQIAEAGISEESIDKNRIFLYSNPRFGRQINTYHPVPLVENARGFTEKDDHFKKGDYLYFYGNSPSGIVLNQAGTIDFDRNPFSFENYYWVLIADQAASPKQIDSFSSENSATNYIVTTTDYLYRKEKERGAANILKSGNDWYGKLLDGKGSSTTESFVLPDSDTNYPADIVLRMKSGTESSPDNPTFQKIQVYLNNTYLASRTMTNYSVYTLNLQENLNPSTNIFGIKFIDGVGKAYIDYLQCKYKIALEYDQGNCLFFAPEVDGLIEYQIKNPREKSFEIYDITDKANIKKLNLTTNNEVVIFRDYNSGGKRKQYIMAAQSDFSSVEEIEMIESPDFNSLYQPKTAQYIIITDELLLSAAEYIADIHNSKVSEEKQLSTFITTQNNIFRQFNGDVRDSELIRHFLKYAYENWNIPPEYVLLLGDGTYDHRELETDTKNLVMTYQVNNFSHSYYYQATDFRFTYLTGNDRYPDVAIGRIPASDLSEANAYAAKLENYLLNPTFGQWRHTISLVADDPEGPHNNETYFTSDSEKLTDSILPSVFTYNKLYLLEYPDANDSGDKFGRSKPAATAAILTALKEGTTIINYMGHGAPNKWSQESAFTAEELPQIDNAQKLPLWIAGTCTWGKFDDIYDDCMPENLITLRNHGGIVTLGATRPTGGSQNFSFLTQLFNYWFPNNTIKNIRFGDVLKNVMNGYDSNDEKYVLFGDPAIHIALPYQKAGFQSMAKDTLKALEKTQISGNSEQENFSGNAIVTLYDSKQSVTRYYMSEKVQKSYSYQLPGDLLFRGNVKVEQGRFQSSFYIPKDLNYNNNTGKLHVYGWNEETQEEFAGAYTKVYFAGSENIADSIGPAVEFLRNESPLFDGGLINPEDQLQLKLTDKYGINLTGKMGHGISVTIDENDPLDLTANFAYLENNDTSGTLTIPLDDIDFGAHDITIKAWDNANNSSTRNFNFTYLNTEKFKISKIVNYPNPFRVTTDITFYSSEPCDFSITIYAVNGLKIREFDRQQSSLNGFNRVYWDGKDGFGDKVARGIYFYKIKAKSLETNKKDNFIGKMVKS